MIIGIIGLGFVGNAIYQSFIKKGISVFGYDKFKSIGTIENCLKADVLFLALPTVYNYETSQYDKQPIIDTCDYLTANEYKGVVVIKSTVEPYTTDNLSIQFPSLQFIHNPEFLRASSAEEDFHNQEHIVLGRATSCTDDGLKLVERLYVDHYPYAVVSICTSTESEMMKIFVNSFYSVKIQFFTELFLTCQHTGSDYKKIRDMMIRNGNINPSFTNVPGHDGQISYGGLCFPKDTNALNQFMQRNGLPNAVLNACVEERNTMRQDHDNCIVKK